MKNVRKEDEDVMMNASVEVGLNHKETCHVKTFVEMGLLLKGRIVMVEKGAVGCVNAYQDGIHRMKGTSHANHFVVMGLWEEMNNVTVGRDVLMIADVMLDGIYKIHHPVIPYVVIKFSHLMKNVNLKGLGVITSVNACEVGNQS